MAAGPHRRSAGGRQATARPHLAIVGVYGVVSLGAHLLASVIVGRASLWTLDRRLAAVARDLGLAA